jgi:hypothetical protein
MHIFELLRKIDPDMVLNMRHLCSDGFFDIAGITYIKFTEELPYHMVDEITKFCKEHPNWNFAQNYWNMSGYIFSDPPKNLRVDKHDLTIVKDLLIIDDTFDKYA